jgi:hypothetical protein
MKKSLLLFLLSLVGLGGISAQTLEPTEEGIYEIGSAEDLVAFSDLVNAGNYGANAILTADIDMSSVENFTPIGHFGNAADDKYYGTFDGQGHKISNLTAQFPEESDVGLFNTGGDNTHVVIKNLWLDETCYIEGAHRVGLIGNHNHGLATFENLGNMGKVKGNSDNTSMLIGRAWSQSGNVIEVNNCWTIGEVETPGAGSGLCSWASGSCTYKFSNCWTAAEVTAGNPVVVRVQNAGNLFFENCYSLKTAQTGVMRFLEQDLASGELCYTINKALNEPVWFQTIGADTYPVPYSSHGLVYLTEGIGCDGRAKGDVPFSNTDLGISAEPDAHIIVDGLCSVCGQLPLADDGYYEIASGQALAKFSEMVNEGMVQINGRLTADIDMEGIEFAPIGLFGDVSPLKLNYYGTLDGCKHIISNLTISTDEWYEAGLISRAYNATVKDLGVLNASIRSNNPLGRIGVIAGFSRNSTFINCWSAGTLSLVCTEEEVETPQIGGLFGNTNNTAVCTNCWSTYEGALGNGGGTFTNCYGYEGNPNIEEDAASGALCYAMNNSSFIDVSWFQKVGEDICPSQNEERGIVYKTTSGFSTLQPEDEASFIAFRDNTIEVEKEFAEEAVACQALLDEYKQKISILDQTETFEGFCEAYGQLSELKQSIAASIAAYEAYAATCQAAITYLSENEFSNETRTLLEKYLTTEVEPNETFPHGSYPYIMDLHELNDQEIAAEASYVELMLQKAISGGFVAGTDITVLIANSDFKDEMNGWNVESTNGGVTTGGEGSVMKLAQGLNTVFSAEQTLSEIPNGIYLFSANAFTRPFGDFYSLLNTGQLYLNGNSNFVMTIAEDVVKTEDAQDGVNCHLTGEGPDDKFESEVEGYVPASLAGASYAFGGGRYANYTAVEVTDGTLTLGVRNLGSGLENDWMPFGGLRVIYLGTAEEGSASLVNVLKGYQDRAENILNFIWSETDGYAKYPNMSEALKADLRSTLSESQAEDISGEQMMTFINKFSTLFDEVYNCRKAYVAVFRAAENLIDQAEVLKDLIESDAYDGAWSAASEALQAYQEGSMTTEEALAKVAELEEMTNGLGGLHKDEDDFYLIGNAHDLVLFSVIVNEGDLDANAKLTNDIDMSSVENFTGIGVARNSLYTGTFDGQGHKISGMTISYPGKEDVGFFHIAKATLKNFWLDETCLIEGSKGVALVGWCNGDSPEFENIGVAAQIKGGENTSSFIGRAWKNPQFKNCWSIGEIDNSVGGGTKSNTGVFMGWCNNWGGSFTNCWTTATFAIAPADGNYLTRKGDNVIFNNTYSLYGSQASRMTEDDVTSGALCFKLNSDQSEIAWYQTLGVDAHPVLDSTHGIVYLAVDQYCDGTPKGDPVYSNTAGGTRDDHQFENGICMVCGAYDPNLIIDGVYQISLPIQLVWFSDYVNTKDSYANARLTADIDMSSVENFTPIGLYGDNAEVKKNYYGTFDGARHIISNLTVNTDGKYEAGLFGRAYKATVKDLGIENATIMSNDKNGRIGVIAGFNRESTFINCWSAGTLTLTCTDETVESPQIGGIFGNTNNTAICTNCWSTYEGALGTGGGTLTNCYSFAEDPDIAAKAQSGALCYALNQGAGETIYYQLIGEDLHPVFDESRGEVILNEDGTYTGIKEIENGNWKQGTVVYDLMGRKVEKSQISKGVYIVNGRKVLLK